MELISILLTLLAGGLLLLILCMLYLFVYKRHINKVLTEPHKKHLRMMPPHKVLMALVLLLAAASASMATALAPERIATAEGLEAHIRTAHGMDRDWTVEVAMYEDHAAVIAYDSPKEEHTFSIYHNDGRWLTRFVFRYGGKATSVERSVRVFHFPDATAFVSMNAPHISAIECHSGERYELDPDLPFALVIPGGGYTVYDSNGQVMELSQDLWYEQTKVG